MSFSERISARSLGDARLRAESEVRALLEAAFAVLRRAGIDGLTLALVLEEAGLSTRAFYRHFASKDELVLALFARESERAGAGRAAALARATRPGEALQLWIDDVLALAYEPRRAERTRVLQSEAARLSRDFPTEFARIVDAELHPLVSLLRAGRDDGSFPASDPDVDARTIHAIVWSLARARLDGRELSIGDVRAHVHRYVEPALGIRTRS